MFLKRSALRRVRGVGGQRKDQRRAVYVQHKKDIYYEVRFFFLSSS